MIGELEKRFLQNDENSLKGTLRICGRGPLVAATLRRRYVVLNWHDIEDILIVGLHRLWKHRSKFDPSRASLRSLFLGIADNVARDLFKYGWQRTKNLEITLDQVCGKSLLSADSPVDSDVSNEVLEDVRRIVNRLPEAYRHIVLADCYARDRLASTERLAEELELSASTVRVYRVRAMEAIRTELAKLGYEVDK